MRFLDGAFCENTAVQSRSGPRPPLRDPYQPLLKMRLAHNLLLAREPEGAYWLGQWRHRDPVMLEVNHSDEIRIKATGTPNGAGHREIVAQRRSACGGSRMAQIVLAAGPKSRS